MGFVLRFYEFLQKTSLWLIARPISGTEYCFIEFHFCGFLGLLREILKRPDDIYYNGGHNRREDIYFGGEHDPLRISADQLPQSGG